MNHLLSHRMNFQEVNVFYTDLNFETIVEQADYEVDITGTFMAVYSPLFHAIMCSVPVLFSSSQRDQFLSDFGGTIGLWVGATFITAVELLTFLLHLFCVKCCKNGEKAPMAKSSPQRRASPQDSLNDSHFGSGHSHYSQAHFNNLSSELGLKPKLSPRIWGFKCHMSSLQSIDAFSQLPAMFSAVSACLHSTSHGFVCICHSCGALNQIALYSACTEENTTVLSSEGYQLRILLHFRIGLRSQIWIHRSEFPKLLSIYPLIATLQRMLLWHRFGERELMNLPSFESCYAFHSSHWRVHFFVLIFLRCDVMSQTIFVHWIILWAISDYQSLWPNITMNWYFSSSCLPSSGEGKEFWVVVSQADSHCLGILLEWMELLSPPHPLLSLSPSPFWKCVHPSIHIFILHCETSSHASNTDVITTWVVFYLASFLCIYSHVITSLFTQAEVTLTHVLRLLGCTALLKQDPLNLLGTSSCCDSALKFMVKKNSWFKWTRFQSILLQKRVLEPWSEFMVHVYRAHYIFIVIPLSSLCSIMAQVLWTYFFFLYDASA